jgi:hypothetical protein
LWFSTITFTNISSTNITVNNLSATYITNFLEYSTNLFVTTNITDVSYVTNLFVDNSIITNLTVNNVTNNIFNTTNVTINYPGGLTNLNLTAKTVMWADQNQAVSSVANALGILTNNSAGDVGFSTTLSLTEIDALNFYPTNLFTGLTNYNLLGTDANGLLTLGSGAITNISVTITNNTFVNTNLFISTSNAYFNYLYATNTYFDTNFVTNLYFVSGKGNTLIVTNIFVAEKGSLVNSNTTINSAVITDDKHAYTNAVNAHGVFTNSATGPPSFGLLQNTELKNSSITVQGAAVSLGGTTLAVGSQPVFDLQSSTNLLLASVSSPTNGVFTASSIDFTVPEAVTNIAGAVSQTSVANFNQTNINHAIRWYVNRTGSDQTITVGTWETDSGRTSATTYTCTNNTTLGLMFTLYAGQFTNVASMKTFR